MPNPQIIDCPAGVWTKIATDQIFGYLYPNNKKPIKYLYTYRLTGGAAPTNGNEGAEIFLTDERKIVIAIGDDGAVRYDWWW